MPYQAVTTDSEYNYKQILFSILYFHRFNSSENNNKNNFARKLPSSFLKAHHVLKRLRMLQTSPQLTYFAQVHFVFKQLTTDFIGSNKIKVQHSIQRFAPTSKY